MSLSKFVQHKKNFENTVGWKDLANKYGQLGDSLRCVEETYQEKIRWLMTDPRTPLEEEPKPELKDMVAKANNTNTFMQNTCKDLTRKFWKRQLSNTFTEGDAPPCPILTSLMLQRYDVDFCYVRHCAKTIDQWIEWHNDAMRKFPTMLTGNHTSCCVHNAFTQVVKQIQCFEDFTEEVDVTDILIKKLSENTTKRCWLRTEGLERYMLSEECSDTLIIQNKDIAKHYANVMCQGDTVEREDNTWIDRDWLKELASRPTKLNRAAYSLETDVQHDVQHLVRGLIDLNTYICLATSDILEITRETVKCTSNSAVPTETTKIILSGFGFLAALELASTILGDSAESIEKVVYRNNKSIFTDHYGHRHSLRDTRELQTSCVNEQDWFRRDETCTTDEDTSEDGGMDTDEDIGEPMAQSTLIEDVGEDR